MQILLKFNWESKVLRKAKIYLLSVKNKKLIDQTFDKFYKLKKMSQSKNATFFLYHVFYVQKTQNRKLKKRVVIDIYKFNAIIQLNVYLISI